MARNIAAHGGRFYNRTRLSPAVKLPLVMRRAHVDNSSPFAYFYAIFELLPDAEKFNLIRAMEKLFKKYPAAEPSRMGFPVEIPGPGGMPVGTNGKAMLLLSGGIASPVAGFMVAKRGVKIDAGYFH